MKLNRMGYLIKEGIKSIFTHGFMSFASVTVIVACLIIMGSFSLLAVNIDNIIGELEQENSMLAFVDEELTEEEALEIQPRIEAIPNVSYVEFITREEAMDNFIAKYDDASKFSDLDASTFRNRYVIYLDDLSLMATTYQAVSEVRGIADVNAHLEISQGFITVRNIVSVISLILIVILLVVSVFIMANTIKLATFGRKEEIAIMKMVGASNSFIRCPFVIEGLVLGLLGGVIAFFIQWGVYTLICGKVMSGLIGNFVTVLPFAALMLPVLLVFVAVGLVVGVFGSNIAIRNYLKV
jgi:cell division transport system permease protein